MCFTIAWGKVKPFQNITIIASLHEEVTNCKNLNHRP